MPSPVLAASSPVSRLSSAATQLTLLSIAMVLGMSPWFAASVVGGAMMSAYESWLTIAVQLGFVSGTLASAILMLSDRWSPRRLAGGSALVAAAATAGVALPGLGPAPVLVLRLLTGAALAGLYPPGMKITAGWWKHGRGLAIGVVVGALTLGSASPNLIRTAIPADAWRPVLLVAAGACALSAILFFGAIREGPFQAPSQPFDVRAVSRVLGSRGFRLATAGYLGHMWELYAMWAAMTPFWTYVAASRGLASAVGHGLAFASIGVGLFGCVIAGRLADRAGRALVTIVAMAVSGTCALAVGTLLHGPLLPLITLMLVWGVSVVADSAQFSACVTELAPQEYVGTALTLQTCLGFLLTIVTIKLVPEWAARWGWEWAFAPLAVGPVLGIAAMAPLIRATTPRSS